MLDPRIQRVLETIVDSINGNYFSLLEKKANQCIRAGVRQFYAAYHPRYYHRTFSLYSMAKPVISNNVFQLKIGAEYSEGGHTVGEDEIYETVFEEGYHGGAKYGIGHPSPGVPRWRKPYPHFTEWGSVARQSKPPYDAIVEKWNTFVDSQANVQKEKIIDRVFSAYGKQLEQAILASIIQQLQMQQ